MPQRQARRAFLAAAGLQFRSLTGEPKGAPFKPVFGLSGPAKKETPLLKTPAFLFTARRMSDKAHQRNRKQNVGFLRSCSQAREEGLFRDNTHETKLLPTVSFPDSQCSH